MKNKINNKNVMRLLACAKRLAKEYYKATGRPLGVTGEIAEYEATQKLKLKLSDPRQEGHDAIRRVGNIVQKVQIKGRCVVDKGRGQRVGRIRTDKTWDVALLVLLNEDYEATEIYEAKRSKIIKELNRPGSVARNKRRTLSISKFKKLGKSIWKLK